MKAGRLLPALGLAGFLSACAVADHVHDVPPHEHLDESHTAQLDEIKIWLGYPSTSGAGQADYSLYEWLEELYEAVCTLEEDAGIEDGICTDPMGDPDPTGGPPPPPPWD